MYDDVISDFYWSNLIALTHFEETNKSLPKVLFINVWTLKGVQNFHRVWFQWKFLTVDQVCDGVCLDAIVVEQRYSMI